MIGSYPAVARFGPLDLQVDGDAVWVVGVAGALRIDPRRNVPDRFVPIAETARGTVTDGDGVWVLTAGGRLRHSTRAPAGGSGMSTCPSLASPASPGWAGRVWVGTPGGRIVVVRSARVEG